MNGRKLEGDDRALRELAERLDAYTGSQVEGMTGWNENTREAYRRRGELVYMRVGKYILHPREPFHELIRRRNAKRKQRAVPPASVL